MMKVAQLREALALLPDDCEVKVGVDWYQSTHQIELMDTAVYIDGVAYLMEVKTRRGFAPKRGIAPKEVAARRK